MKILAIVVTYYPEKDLLKNNINAFIEHVDKVLIWENTPVRDKTKCRFINNEKVEYHCDGVNSISHGLNYGWQYAKEYGYDYLLTMDQDSVFDNFEQYLQHTIYNPEAPQGIWGPNAYCSNLDKIIENDKIITSGMLLKLEILDQVGGWNEGFDIDCVDEELCLYALSKGIKSYWWGNCILRQTYGTPRKVKFFSKSVTLRNDSPYRLFSIYKCHVQLMRMYPENQLIWSEFRNNWIPIVKWILIYENHRIRKLFAISRGVIIGLLCKTPRRL